jgi:hypothetical protein
MEKLHVKSCVNIVHLFRFFSICGIYYTMHLMNAVFHTMLDICQCIAVNAFL